MAWCQRLGLVTDDHLQGKQLSGLNYFSRLREGREAHTWKRSIPKEYDSDINYDESGNLHEKIISISFWLCVREDLQTLTSPFLILIVTSSHKVFEVLYFLIVWYYVDKFGQIL